MLTLNEIHDLTVQFKARQGAPQWWDIIPICVAFTGLCIGEVIGLPASDVDGLPSHRVKVARQFSWTELLDQARRVLGNRVPVWREIDRVLDGLRVGKRSGLLLQASPTVASPLVLRDS